MRAGVPAARAGHRHRRRRRRSPTCCRSGRSTSGGRSAGSASGSATRPTRSSRCAAPRRTSTARRRRRCSCPTTSASPSGRAPSASSSRSAPTSAGRRATPWPSALTVPAAVAVLGARSCRRASRRGQDLTSRSMAFVASPMSRPDSSASPDGHRAGHAVAEVLVEQADGDALQRLRGRRHLGQDVDAVLVVLDHPLQSAHLTFDAAQPLQVVVALHRVAAGRGHDTTQGYHRRLQDTPGGICRWLASIPPGGTMNDVADGPCSARRPPASAPTA